MNFTETLNLYQYDFPKSLIAKMPASPRDAAKLLIYKRTSGEVFYDRFSNLSKYLPKNAVLVFNETKVIPARIPVRKETGGKALLLYIETCGELIKIMADRKLTIGSKLYLSAQHFFIIEKQEKKYYFLRPSFPLKKLYEVLEKYGLTPLPPYIKDVPLSEKSVREKYQTIFAKYKGSVAAPTASLHFTKRLFKKLAEAGIQKQFVTLHVNLGTFAPLTEQNLAEKKLHKEYFEISETTAKALNKAKKEGRPIIAVGTTVMRTLESASNGHSILSTLTDTTDLFISEGYKFKFVAGMITNFHVPQSSLMMLVATLTGRETLLELYKKAISKKFRLFSFGDGMLIL